MERLIIARHGNYNSKTGHLTKSGEKQIEKLAEFIKNACEGSYCFNSSIVIRAVESAKILKNKLDKNKEIELLEELLDEEEYLTLYKARKIHDCVFKKIQEADNLILSSHYSIATGYSTYFMQTEFGKIKPVPEVPKGKAVLIDIIKKDYDILPN